MGLPEKFNYVTKKMFGKNVKVLQNACNRMDMSCCGGGGGGGGCCMSMFLHVNNHCNSNCNFCIADNQNNRMISDFPKLDMILNELTENQTISKVVLTGGEPLLHPKFELFLEMLDKYPLQWYSLNTNGTFIKKKLTAINASKLKHINISTHHYDDEINKKIMGKCLTFDQLQELRELIKPEKEIRLACTITKDLYKEDDIMKYIEKSKSIGINNVIFRNEYNGFNKYLEDFKIIWKKLYHADICNCGYKLIKGVNSEFRQSNVKLKQMICDADLYVRDFIYKDDDILSGSWEYNSQIIY